MALTKLPRNAIGTGAIDTTKIEDGTIQAVELSGTLPDTKLSSTLDISGKTVTLPNTSVTSDQLVNTTIANAKLSNSTITVRGTSRALGDSFTIGTDVDWQTVKTASFNAVAGEGYFVNTTSGVITVTLPTSASIGDQIAIKDYAGTFATNNLTIARNGHNIQGVANNSLISTNRASLVLVYVDATKGWLFTDEHNISNYGPTFITATGGTVTESGDFKIHTFTGGGSFVVSTLGNDVAGTAGNNVDYLVIAGGGGGGSYQSGVDFGRGGGAGGYREGKRNAPDYTASPLVAPAGLPVSVTTYPITIGSGGAGTGSVTPGSNGSSSIFSTITSAAGGGGGSHTTPGNPGGSGGGGSPSSGSGNSPPVSPPQGFPGSNQGGGAGGPGKNGTTSSINGTPTTRAGGGGGVDSPGGTGGGGTYGGTINGTVNTGSGGGGGGASGAPGVQAGGAGGSGIVIIRYKFQ